MKQPKSGVNIAFAGLTAAGKTTHAKLLAKALGYEYISATATILEIIGIDHAPDRVWFTNYEKIQNAREGDKVDIELEARMRKMADQKGGLVLDTWAMAWIYDGPRPMIRLWLESDAPSRTRKCYVSQDEDKELDLENCRQLIDQKDTETRDNFLRRLGFDLFQDRQRYDIVLDNSMIMPHATTECSEAGIKAFAPVVQDAVDYMIRMVDDPGYDADGQTARMLMKKHAGMILCLGHNNSKEK
jgi:cytidylate kinase